MVTEKITKENIIEYLQDYYKKYKKSPIARDKEHPFSENMATNKFGTWNKALIEAGIPLSKNNALEVKCKQCEKIFKKLFNQIKRSNNNFCSQSCSGIYNNKHRKTGNRISKLELFLQKNLKGYNFSYNNREICNGLELDIFISELKLAFEISGIVHYKPIYGEEKFNKIIEKDKLKMQRCIDKNINLIVIKDESMHFNEQYGYKILLDIYLFIHKSNFKNGIKFLNKK